MSDSAFRRLLRDPSLSAVAAGFVTVPVGFTRSVAIVFQAVQALGAPSGMAVIRASGRPVPVSPAGGGRARRPAGASATVRLLSLA